MHRVDIFGIFSKCGSISRKLISSIISRFSALDISSNFSIHRLSIFCSLGRFLRLFI